MKGILEFLRPKATARLVDAYEEARLERAREDAKWREYDSPAIERKRMPRKEEVAA